MHFGGLGHETKMDGARHAARSEDANLANFDPGDSNYKDCVVNYTICTDVILIINFCVCLVF